jgi:Sugar (and other) transporter
MLSVAKSLLLIRAPLSAAFLLPSYSLSRSRRLQIGLLVACPESPVFLAEHARLPAAAIALKRLRCAFDVSDEVARLESAQLSSGPVRSLSFLGLLRTRAAFKSTVVAVSYHAIQQFSGINAVFFFATTLFSNLGLNPKIVAAAIGAFNILITGVSVALMDRSGRRPLALASTAIMALGAIGIFLSLAISISILCLLCIFVFVGGFAVGLGPVPWVILGDIFPSTATEAGVSLAIGVNWSAQILLAFVLLDIKNALDFYLFLIFAAFLILFFIFNYFYIPETKGKPPQFL